MNIVDIGQRDAQDEIQQQIGADRHVQAQQNQPNHDADPADAQDPDKQLVIWNVIGKARVNEQRTDRSDRADDECPRQELHACLMQERRHHNGFTPADPDERHERHPVEKHQAGPLFAPDIQQPAEKTLEGRLRGKFGAPSDHGAAKYPDKTDFPSSPSSPNPRPSRWPRSASAWPSPDGSGNAARRCLNSPASSSRRNAAGRRQLRSYRSSRRAP